MLRIIIEVFLVLELKESRKFKLVDLKVSSKSFLAIFPIAVWIMRELIELTFSNVGTAKNMDAKYWIANQRNSYQKPLFHQLAEEIFSQRRWKAILTPEMWWLPAFSRIHKERYTSTTKESQGSTSYFKKKISFWWKKGIERYYELQTNPPCFSDLPCGTSPCF